MDLVPVEDLSSTTKGLLKVSPVKTMSNFLLKSLSSVPAIIFPDLTQTLVAFNTEWSIPSSTIKLPSMIKVPN